MFSTSVEIEGGSNLTNRCSLEVKLLHGKHTCEQILGLSWTEFLLILSSRYGCLSFVLFSLRWIRLHVLDAHLKYNIYFTCFYLQYYLNRLDTRIVSKLYIKLIHWIVNLF